MNVVIENENKNNKKLKILYIGILSICIIAVIVTILIQIFTKDDEKIGGNSYSELTENQANQYKSEFDNIFQNKVNYGENNGYKISKLETDKEIIFVNYQNNESKLNDYELDVNIPYININNNIIQGFNTQIKDIFEKKAKSIVNTENNNIIYTVKYSAYISNNILSLIIRSTLKEGTEPQRDIVQTYNYDLTNQKIKEEIKNSQKKAEELQKLGYSTYTSDYTSDIYSINNVTEYFIGEDNSLYIIYAYGNENNTNEMDIVVM